MKPIRLLNLGSIPAGQTQAIYHVLAERMDDSAQDTIVICRPNQPYLCLGYHQVFESIFDPEECQRRGLPVYRRQIGGGATYLDENQLFYQCVFHHSHLPVMVKDLYACTLAAPVMALRSFGLGAELRDTNEIELLGKRIAGTGGGRIGEATVVVGNLLFDFDFDTMAAVWHTPTSSFRLLAEKAMQEYIVNLNQLSIKLPMEKVADVLIESFAISMGRVLEPGTLTIEEVQAAQEKAKELASADFLVLHNPGFIPEPMRMLKISTRAYISYDEVKFDGYTLKGSFWLTEEMIREVILESTPARQWHTTEKKLSGIPYNKWKEQLAIV